MTEARRSVASNRLLFLAARAGEPRWSFYKLPAQPGCQIATVKNPADDGYTLEAAIPFATLGITPVENQELIFDLGINDATQRRRPHPVESGEAGEVTRRGGILAALHHKQ